MGPNFLQAVISGNHCPGGIIVQNAFESNQKFCDFFNRSSRYIKDCLTDAAFRIIINLHGIVEYDTNFGKCCTKCSGTVF